MNKLWVSVFGFIILTFTAVAWASPVPDTGQTKCYDVSGKVITCPSQGQALYGQDANYTINPMSYTKLDGSGNVLPDSTTSWVTSWVMVKDNVTGLIWEMKTNKDGVKNYNDPHDADNLYTWYDSNPATNGGNAGKPASASTNGPGSDTEAFLKALNSAHFGGYSDWRLPTINELDSIVNYDIPYPGPDINTTYFPNTQSSFVYLSSTTYAFHTYYAWGMNFSSGYARFYDKVIAYSVRAVRGGQSQSAYVNNGNGTVTDTSTGLMWQQEKPDKTMTWEQALSYCENLPLAGYTDWRLPTKKELRSLVDYNRFSPAINTLYFPDTVSSLYWSSTTIANTNSTYKSWCIYFDYGDGDGGNKVDGHYVRAVRGGQAPTQTACTATLDGNLLLHIPYLSYGNGALSLWADLLYEFNPTYPTLIPFKLTNYAIINDPSFSCTASTLASDLTIHIPDVLFPDGVTHIWVDLAYSPALSTGGNFYWVVSNYGTVSN